MDKQRGYERHDVEVEARVGRLEGRGEGAGEGGDAAEDNDGPQHIPQLVEKQEDDAALGTTRRVLLERARGFKGGKNVLDGEDLLWATKLFTFGVT